MPVLAQASLTGVLRPYCRVLWPLVLIGQWHGLSDPKLECALKVRLDFMIFCGLDLNTPVPDETTPWRFPNSLVKGKVYDELLAEVCPHLEVHGLKLKQAQGAILDGTLVESPARPCRFIDAANDREEGEEAEPEGGITYSADPDAPWVKKGAKSTKLAYPEIVTSWISRCVICKKVANCIADFSVKSAANPGVKLPF